jgi:hypothetical protein
MTPAPAPETETGAEEDLPMTPAPAPETETGAEAAPTTRKLPPANNGGGGLVALLRDKPYVFLIVFGIFILLPPGIFIVERSFIADRTPQFVQGSPRSQYSQKLYITINEIDVDSGTAQFGVQFTTLNQELANQQIEAIITNGEFVSDERGETAQQLIETSQHRARFTMPPPPETLIQQDDIVFEKNDLQIRVEGQADLYPFDTYQFRLQSNLSTAKNHITQYHTYFWLDDPQLIYYARPESMRRQENGSLTYRPNTMQVTVRRPAYFILYIVSILLLLFFIVIWTLWRVYHKGPQSTESAFEVLGLNLAIILAIPDVRGLLVPAELTYVPVIDTSLATITMLSIYCVVIYIVNRNAMRKTAQANEPADTDETNAEEEA